MASPRGDNLKDHHDNARALDSPPSSFPKLPSIQNVLGSSSGQTDQKRKVKKACVQCKQSHACCDCKRPCGRCIRNNTPDQCVDAESKKRGRKTKAQKAAEAILRMNGTSAAADSLRVLQTDVQHASSPLALLATASPAAAPLEPLLDQEPLSVAPPSASSSSALAAIPPLNKRMASLAPPPLPSVMAGLELSPLELATLRQAAAERDRGTLTDMNRVLLAEIRELKADQERMADELRVLRHQQQQQRQAAAAAAAAQSAASNGVSQTNVNSAAVVVYDLTKKPTPVVQSANMAFCHMLGYSMEEAHGASWHKFVYPPYVDRARNILGRHLIPREGQSTTSVTFEQVYQHKDGSLVRTMDSHNIFFINNTPTSDVITVSPLPSTGSLPSISYDDTTATTTTSAAAPGLPLDSPALSLLPAADSTL